MPVISKNFAHELNDKDMRTAYLDAQTRAKLAQQIRILRAQRGLSQRELGEMMNKIKPQSNIARLEDREIGRYTLTTLLELASAYDVGLIAKFVPYREFLKDTQNLSPDALQVESFSSAELDALCEERAEIAKTVSKPTVRGAYKHPMAMPDWVCQLVASNRRTHIDVVVGQDKVWDGPQSLYKLPFNNLVLEETRGESASLRAENESLKAENARLKAALLAAESSPQNFPFGTPPTPIRHTPFPDPFAQQATGWPI